MSIVEEIRDLFRDTFYTLPLLILGFLFFFGTMTSNVGILYLLIGHTILVPALSFLSDPASNIFPGGEMNIWNSLASLSSLTIVLWTYAQALGGGYNYLLFLLMIVPYILQAFGFNKSVLFFYNPIAMARSAVYNDEDSAYLASKSGACAMLPNTSLAVTVTVNESPAVRVPGFPERERDEACAGLTWIWETGRESAPSLPDRVCVPEVLSFTEKFA